MCLKPGPNGGDASPAKPVPLMWRPAFWRIMGGVARRGGGRPPKIEGAETFRDGDVLAVPGRPRVIHTPGHTKGHSELLFEDRGARGLPPLARDARGRAGRGPVPGPP